MENNFKTYENYLETLTGHLNKFFAQQEPYIFCKEGCSKCCENGIYPFTRLEVEYMKSGIETLEDSQKAALFERIANLKAESRGISGDEKFFHACPFLVDNKCILYKYRAVECRCHGLTRFYVDEEDKEHFMMPACVDLGLNYSNVFDFEKNVFSQEKVDELNSKIGGDFEPQSYNLGLTFLTRKASFAQGIDFGESKALLYWFD